MQTKTSWLLRFPAWNILNFFTFSSFSILWLHIRHFQRLLFIDNFLFDCLKTTVRDAASMFMLRRLCKYAEYMKKKTNAWRFLICVFLLIFFSFFYILISLFNTLVLDISFGSFVVVVVVILHGIIFETFTFATVRIIVKYYECFTYLCICFSSYFLFYLEWTNSTATPPPTAQHFCKISLFGFHRPIDVLKICLKIYVMDTICSHSWKCFLANTW